MHRQQTAFEKLWEKKLLVTMFLLNQIIVSPLVHIFDIISLFAVELEEPKIGISGKGLKEYRYDEISLETESRFSL